jgi:predicted DNA-binding protein YlxM (UPF0122 family)
MAVAEKTARRTVEQAVREYGRSNFKTDDVKEVLETLYKMHSLDGIAGLLGVTRQAIAHTMKQHEITLAKPGRPSAFLSKVQKLNFECIEDYFRARSIATFESMADELGVSTSTVHRYHREFVARISNAVTI